jgi:tetratricopeptide (TPR) repeat protein
MTRLWVFFSLILLSVFVGGCKASMPKWGSHKYAELAEEQLRKKQYDEACESYRRHVEARLSAKDRPEWENPYFYYLIIGDIRLRQNKVDQALVAYEFAESKKIEPQLISDRFRYVAQWYEKNGELEKAMDILKKYRDRDPLLFDAVLDRIARELTSKEMQISSTANSN